MYVSRHFLSFLACPLLGVALACGDESTAPSSVGDEPDLATSAAAALQFYQVSAGFTHTCGVTTDNRSYCWGSNGYGNLGDGTETNRTRPAAVTGGLRFHQISTGQYSTCAVTTDYRAYCWGYNGYGQLGDGSAVVSRATPTPVAGGIKFAQVETGAYHACGVSYPEKKVYCWGSNSYGQLGDGTTSSRGTPVPLAGGLRFRQVSTGGTHACGVTTDNKAFCWGSNEYGQLGDRTEIPQRNSPALVADGHQFKQVDAGNLHTCAVTTDHRAFCWGNGRNGEIGNGKKYLSFWPRPVAGGLRFDRVTAGTFVSCGETTLNRVYCWGGNGGGALGDGTTTSRLTPVAVAGGLYFAQASNGSGHTCARTAQGKAYCWGFNGGGALGDGSYTNRLKPTAVAGPM
jgi:alpha-tubulin suppressor-like RCC1 family protein